MFLTVNGENGGKETFNDCFDYLYDALHSHFLLTADERERCTRAVEELKSVFARFRPVKKSRS